MKLPKRQQINLAVIDYRAIKYSKKYFSATKSVEKQLQHCKNISGKNSSSTAHLDHKTQTFNCLNFPLDHSLSQWGTFTHFTVYSI